MFALELFGRLRGLWSFRQLAAIRQPLFAEAYFALSTNKGGERTRHRRTHIRRESLQYGSPSSGEEMDFSARKGGLISTVESLEELCGKPGWVALASDTDRIIPKYRNFIEASPYVTIATVGEHGPDCSPRGDAPGFVQVRDEKTLLIPDRVGNNRIETLHNLIHDPRIALHFLVPGSNETLRVKGKAAISNSSSLVQFFTSNGKPPRTVIIVSVERAYFHCGKALRRAGIWTNAREHAEVSGLNSVTASVQWRRCRDVLLGKRT
jgi:uncharacterized protein